MQGENKCWKAAKVYNSAGPQVRFVEESFAWSKFQFLQFDRIILNNIETIMCRVLSLLILIYF